jgi:hypothetical protein
MRSILACCIWVCIVGCSATDQADRRPSWSGPSEADAAAVATAKAFVQEQPWADRFDLTKPWGTYDKGDYWDVFFRMKEIKGKPFRCLVRVDKKSGIAKHIPLK